MPSTPTVAGGNNQKLKEEEIKLQIYELLFSKIGEEQMERIVDEHMNLSEGLGVSVGISGKDKVEKKASLIDEFENIQTALVKIKLLFKILIVKWKILRIRKEHQ